MHRGFAASGGDADPKPPGAGCPGMGGAVGCPTSVNGVVDGQGDIPAMPALQLYDQL